MGIPTQGMGAPAPKHFSTSPLWVATALAVGILAVLCTSAMWINQGHLIFTLDDPYIHFALAHNLTQGHYGINPGEYAAPSSSVLWPWLLTPLTFSDTLMTWGVLTINSLCAAGTLACFWGALPDQVRRGPSQRGVVATLLLCLLISNQFTLVFTGLEHSLQVLTCALMTLGLTRCAQTGAAHWWWLVSIAAAPLLRYECAALSALNLLFLASRGRQKLAAATLLATIAPMAAFSGFLLNLGLGALPTSIITKGNIAEHSSRVMMWLFNLKQNALSIKGGLLGGLAVCMLIYAATQRRNASHAGPAWVLAAAAWAHLVLGRAGYRYDAYLWTAACVLLLANHGQMVQSPRIARGVPTRARAMVMMFALLGAGIAARSATYTAITPLATSNIYEQQMQMRRFTQDFYRGAVAVNDLGLVAYKNTQYVLDLGGLASLEASRRMQRGEPMWWGAMTEAHDVHLVMLYEDMYQPIPPSWRKLGDLKLGHIKLSAAEATVAFFATDCATVRKVMPQLKDFATGLPSGARFELHPQAADTCSEPHLAQAH